MAKRGPYRPRAEPLTRTEALLAAVLVAIEQMRGDWDAVELSLQLERAGLSREQAATTLGTTAASISVQRNRRKRATSEGAHD